MYSEIISEVAALCVENDSLYKEIQKLRSENDRLKSNVATMTSKKRTKIYAKGMEAIARETLATYRRVIMPINGSMEFRDWKREFVRVPDWIGKDEFFDTFNPILEDLYRQDLAEVEKETGE